MSNMRFRSATELHGIPKKRMGQHFLSSSYYAQRIADSIPADTHENVLEIGAGRGALSVFLVKRFPSLNLIEMDYDVIPELKKTLGTGQWVLHECNVLNFDMSLPGNPLHVAGNLPYNIAALIIKKVLLCGSQIKSCTFMVQREVAMRIVSGPHSKQAGFLSIFCQFFGKPELLFHVPPGAFYPPPKVDSSVFRLIVDPQKNEIDRSRWTDFFSFVDKGFSQRRKMLLNSLGKCGDRTVIADSLRLAGIAENARAEDVPAELWVRLFKIMYPDTVS
jgi:16S rRNA (adenine1518-N6/adenine1519-N6)-dimethyltransferase